MNIVKSRCLLPDGVLKDLENANVFYTLDYEAYCRSVGEELWYAYDECYVLVVAVYQKVRLKYAAFPSEPYRLATSGQGTGAAFLEQAEKELKKNGLFSVHSCASALFEEFPKDSKRIPFGSHIIDLTADEEMLWSNVHSKHRNSIRRAEKGEVIVCNGGENLIDAYVLLDNETWARSDQKPYGKDFFTKIMTKLDGNAKIFVAYKDNVPQAAALYFFNDAMAYYMYGASADHSEPGANNLLHWEAIRYFKKIGVKKYSFVGCRIGEDENSKYHTIQRFKERFGGPLQQGYMFKTTLIPWKKRLFMGLYYIKNRHRMTDAIDQEINKWDDLNRNK